MIIDLAEPKITLEPKPGYVIKTRLEVPTASPERKAFTKVFINVCSDSRVPLPEHHNETFRPEIIYPLIINNEWEVPIIVSDERTDKDNKGALSYVYDCFINEKCMLWVREFKDLKKIVTEWCLESVELRFGFSLSREFKFPKLQYKGALTPLPVIKADLEKQSVIKKEIEKLTSEKEHLLMLDAVAESRKIEEEPQISIFGTPAPAKKPLIEEIDGPIKSTPKPMKKELEPLEFEVQFKPLNGQSNYQLLISVRSKLRAKEDYNVEYDLKLESLVITNNNPRFTIKNKVLEIPIPTKVLQQKENKNDFSLVFDSAESTLYILV